MFFQFDFGQSAFPAPPPQRVPLKSVAKMSSLKAYKAMALQSCRIFRR